MMNEKGGWNMTGHQYKELINKNGMKQRFVAKYIGCHYVTLCNYLNGKKQINEVNLQKLNDLLVKFN